METALLLLRLLLAAIFIVAGVAKFLDLKGSEKAFKDFGVPAAIALPSSILLSVAEIVIGLLFLAVAASWYAAIAAAALLLLFVGQMIYQLARGNAPDCHCFGQIHSAPVSGVSIARNGIFALAAIFLISRGVNGQGISLADPRLDLIQLFFGVVIVGLLLAALFYLRKVSKHQSELQRRIDLLEVVARDGGVVVERDEAGNPFDALPIGAVFPQFELPDVGGKTVSLADVRSARLPVLFVFVSPACELCKSMVPEFDRWQSELDRKVKFVFVSSGNSDENLKKFGGDSKKLILLQENREVAEIVHAQWTPTAILMDVNGRIASHTATGDSAIRDLIDWVRSADLSDRFKHFTNGSHTQTKNLIGRSIPDFSLKALNGEIVKRDDLLGRETLVTFWSLTCPHCVSMMDELRDWDKARDSDDPSLVVFSDGDVGKHEEIGLDSPILLEKNYRTAGRLGMFGTPSAVLVNEEGKIITETAVGAPNIWALIGKSQNRER